MAVPGVEYGDQREAVESTRVDDAETELGVFLLWKAARPRWMRLP